MKETTERATKGDLLEKVHRREGKMLIPKSPLADNSVRRAEKALGIAETAVKTTSVPTNKSEDMHAWDDNEKEISLEHYGQEEIDRQATQDIQPLPSPQEARVRLSLPGAYACSTMPRFAPSLLQQPNTVSQDPPPLQAQEEGPSDQNVVEEGMAIARLVDAKDQEEDMSLPHASPEESADTHDGLRLQRKELMFGFSTLKPLLALALVGFIVLLVAVVVTCTLKPNSHQTSVPAPNTPPPSTMAPTSLQSYKETRIQAILPNTTLEVIMEDPQSAQAMAYDWLLEDPILLQTITTTTRQRVLQRFALVTLYHSTGGDHWFNNQNWLNYSVHECSWYSHPTNGEKQVQNFTYEATNTEATDFPNPCGQQQQPSNSSSMSDQSQEDNHYRHLWLYTNNLDGTIPPELSLLSSLRSLNLRSNKALSGSLPTQIGNLGELEAINLGGTGISGTIPSEIGKLSTNLKSIEVPRTRLHGTLPTELGMLKELQVLIFTYTAYKPNGSPSETFLSGTVPTELGNLGKLRLMVMNYNGFTGTLPLQLSKLTQLEHLELDNNFLTGTLPTEIGLMTSVDLFNNHFNQLTGTIPTEIGHLTDCTSIMLAQNPLTGTIPSQLGSLTKLISLHLWLNQLTGSIPTEMGMLRETKFMYLDANMLTGSLPSQMGQLGNLEDLWMLYNHLTGQIPSEFGLLSSLFMMELSSNQFTRIPTELGRMAVIEHLNLARNQLMGPIPSELGLLQTLNNFSSYIPATHGYSVMSDNSATFDYIVQNFLDLSFNNLSGPIPSEMQLLWDISTLNLVNNSLLTGIMPEALCDIDNLGFDCSSPILCGCNCSCTGSVGSAEVVTVVTNGTKS